jgi:hypothetical protein
MAERIGRGCFLRGLPARDIVANADCGVALTTPYCDRPAVFGIRNDAGEKGMLFAPQRGVRMPRRAGLMLRRKSEPQLHMP